MTYLFLASFIAGLLLGVRVMFFGAERRRRRSADALPLRRSEPAIIGFLLMFGIAGYLLTRRGTVSAGTGALIAALLGLVWAVLVTRLAVATARIQPEHDPERHAQIRQAQRILEVGLDAISRLAARDRERNHGKD